MDIKKIIQEEYRNVIDEQTIDPNQKQTAIQNVNRHIRLLKLMKANIDQIKMPPEYEKMAEELKKADTATFLQQFLQVKDDIPVKIGSILTDPLAVIQAVIHEVINGALKKAREKLQEGSLPNLTKDFKAKHDKKIAKKFGKKIPPAKLDESEDIKNTISKLEKDAKKWQELSAKRHQRGDLESSKMAKIKAQEVFEKAKELRKQHNVRPEIWEEEKETNE
jgi:hypothetical protein